MVLKESSLLHSTENNQSVPDLCEPEFESHSFASPDDGVLVQNYPSEMCFTLNVRITSHTVICRENGLE